MAKEIDLAKLEREEEGLQEYLDEQEWMSDNEKAAFRKGYLFGKRVLAARVYWEIEANTEETVCLACGAAVVGAYDACPFCGEECFVVSEDHDLVRMS